MRTSMPRRALLGLFLAIGILLSHGAGNSSMHAESSAIVSSALGEEGDLSITSESATKISQWVATQEWLGPISAVALSPFFGLACLTGMATYGPEWMQQNPLLQTSGPMNNPVLFWILASLTIVTSLPRWSKLSKPIAFGVETIEAYASILIIVLMRLSVSYPEDGVTTVGQLSADVSFAGLGSVSVTVLMSLAMAINLIVVNTIKMGLDIIVWVIPIPGIDAVVEIANKVLCGLLLALFAISPLLATIVDLSIFVACALLYGFVVRRLVYYRECVLYPIIERFIPSRDPVTSSATVFLGARWHGYPRLTRCELILAEGGAQGELMVRRWFSVKRYWVERCKDGPRVGLVDQCMSFESDFGPLTLLARKGTALYHASVAMATAMMLLLGVQGVQAQSLKTAIVDSEFVFDSASFPSCHASTIEQSNGAMVAAWFGGTHEKHPDVGIWFSRQNDEVWSPPREVANGVVEASDRRAGVPDRYPTWNPVLFQPRRTVDATNPPLVLFYKVGPTPETWWGMMQTSGDGGQTWTKASRLPDGFLGPIKNKPVELPDGTWLCPSSTESEEDDSRWQVHFEWTRDGGSTWQRTSAINDGIAIRAIQPSLLHLGAEHWLAIGRTREDRVFETETRDAGRSWSPMRLGSLPNNNSGLDAITLHSGMHLVVYNHVAGTPGEWGGKRTPLNVALSKDGTTWHPALELESEPGEFSYPAVMQSSDGMVHITYTWNRKKIKHVVLDPSHLVLGP